MATNARAGFGPQDQLILDGFRRGLHGGRRIPVPAVLASGGWFVPLGQVCLERLGEAAGALVEDAARGRIRTLDHLARTGEEAEAVREFMAAHPASPYADEARQRLAESEGTP